MADSLRFDDDVLLCPVCWHSCLHHGTVTTFDRAQDADNGTAFRITPGADRSVSHSTQLTGNPSLRRGGITIEFTCEDCGNTSTLGIAQHKGCSVLNWQPKQWSCLTNSWEAP